MPPGGARTEGASLRTCAFLCEPNFGTFLAGDRDCHRKGVFYRGWGHNRFEIGGGGEVEGYSFTKSSKSKGEYENQIRFVSKGFVRIAMDG